MRLDIFQAFVAQIEPPRPMTAAALTATLSVFFSAPDVDAKEKVLALSWVSNFVDATRKPSTPEAAPSAPSPEQEA